MGVEQLPGKSPPPGGEYKEQSKADLFSAELGSKKWDKEDKFLEKPDLKRGEEGEKSGGVGRGENSPGER